MTLSASVGIRGPRTFSSPNRSAQASRSSSEGWYLGIVRTTRLLGKVFLSGIWGNSGTGVPEELKAFTENPGRRIDVGFSHKELTSSIDPEDTLRISSGWAPVAGYVWCPCSLESCGGLFNNPAPVLLRRRGRLRRPHHRPLHRLRRHLPLQPYPVGILRP